MNENLVAALKLHEFMLTHHWSGAKLIGPDAGVRFNLRIMRFVRSYLPSVNWKDRYYYLQAQGYWVLANWGLFAATGSDRYAHIATACSDSILATQREDGAWDYPNPEWRGRIATAEGAWASIGLIESYAMTSNRRYLDGVLRWYRFLLDQVRFQNLHNEVAVNYFSNRYRPRIPNNSAFVLRFLAELADKTGKDEYLQLCPGLMSFLANCQMTSGELPYAVAETSSRPVRPHYQCYQYNAYECLDLMRYYVITHDPSAWQVIGKLLEWLQTGVCADGHVRFDCKQKYRRIAYHTTVVAAAFATAKMIGLCGYDSLAERCFSHIRAIQRRDGSFGFSERDYRVLSDRRPYPKALTMMLFHLLTGAGIKLPSAAGKSAEPMDPGSQRGSSAVVLER